MMKLKPNKTLTKEPMKTIKTELKKKKITNCNLRTKLKT